MKKFYLLFLGAGNLIISSSYTGEVRHQRLMLLLWSIILLLLYFFYELVLFISKHAFFFIDINGTNTLYFFIWFIFSIYICYKCEKSFTYKEILEVGNEIKKNKHYKLISLFILILYYIIHLLLIFLVAFLD